MKTLIAYSTRYGTSEACARSIAEAIGEDSVLLDLRKGRLADGSRPDMTAYDAVIIGGPIYGGKIMREVPAFCEAHRAELESKTVGLYICCLYEGERAEAELSESYPAWLRAHAVGSYALGGAVTVSRLSVVDRYLMRKVAKTESDLNTVSEEKIRALVADVVRKATA